MTTELERLSGEFRKYCEALGVARSFPTVAIHDGGAHVEISGASYHYVITERGQEYERRSTNDSNELMYWLLSDVVFDLSVAHELANRVPGQDSRRIIFRKEIELLGILKQDWARRKEDDIRRTLGDYPYKDSD